MLQFQNLSGRREAKEYTEPHVIASPVEGEFKITPKVAKQLGIEDGSFVAVVENDGDVYLAKGKDGEAKLDEDGNPIFDDRGRQQFEENTSFGVIARPTSPTNNVFKITASSAWRLVDGDKNKNMMFELEEGVEGEVPTPIKGYKHKATFYKLKFVDSKDKARSGDDDTATDKAENVEVEDEGNDDVL